MWFCFVLWRSGACFWSKCIRSAFNLRAFELRIQARKLLARMQRPSDREDPKLTHDNVQSPSSNVSKEAFTLLHSQYPNSDWAMRTKYYY